MNSRSGFWLWTLDPPLSTRKHWSFSGKDTAPGHRRAALVSGDVGSTPTRCSWIFDNLAFNQTRP